MLLASYLASIKNEAIVMSQMTVRNIPDPQYAALKRVAASNNRSAEAELRHLIARHVGAQGGDGFGSKLVSKYRGIVDQELQFERDRTSSDPVTFE
ncbi:MAG: hypothetical protein OXF88_07855 [Rhodobacteraceae bacterium]|nr:hypothetical protein [Paracoccaceae bacterium]MCY4136703.1 hypothetical protein [Paracoccaceae bacterium]